MPLRVNIGLSKKVGLPEYGSLGASANLELELDSGAANDPERLRQHVRHLFGLAKASVEEELHQQQAVLPNAGRKSHRENPRVSQGNTASDGQRPLGRASGRVATQSQVRAIKAIANRLRLDLALQLEQYGVRDADELSVQQASELIDDLNAQPAGAGGSR